MVAVCAREVRELGQASAEVIYTTKRISSTNYSTVLEARPLLCLQASLGTKGLVPRLLTSLT